MSSMTTHEIGFEIGQMEIVAAEQTAAELMLPEWGLWKRKGNSLKHLDYPPCILPFRAGGTSAPEMAKVIAEITDEQGNRIELAIRALPKPYRLLVTALYLSRTSVRDLAKFTQRSRQHIDHMHNRALGMLQEKLCN
jgi:DNA-directed RNA polymerase specialized sigma24 family protein